MYSEMKIGIINQLNSITGVGEISTSIDTYLFVMTDALDKSLKVGDKVIFRAEFIHNQKKAFFVQKAENYNIKDYEPKEEIYDLNEN